MRNYCAPEVKIVSLLTDDIVCTSNVQPTKGENEFTDIYGENSWID